jgi:hypothetical protein
LRAWFCPVICTLSEAGIQSPTMSVCLRLASCN